MVAGTLKFEQIHVQVGRNATDDFNPFHDPQRWGNIRRNPFAGPIVLGFQLECLLEAEVALRCERTDGLRYSCYEVRFVSAVLPGQMISLEIGAARKKAGEGEEVVRRVRLFADGKLALTGYKREAERPLYLQDRQFKNLDATPDRSLLQENWFLKRKFMTTSNAKNFLCASLVDPAQYIDELAERVTFPEMFPCALLSNALLERAWHEGHNFEAQPLVYRSHHLCVDRTLMESLHSNDALHLLNRPLEQTATRASYETYGVLDSGGILFRGKIDLAPV